MFEHRFYWKKFKKFRDNYTDLVVLAVSRYWKAPASIEEHWKESDDESPNDDRRYCDRN